jgi:hypothetical protein
MSVLKNKRHEKFCQCIARGNSPSIAWIGAGYTPDLVAPVFMLCQPAIIARVKELLPFYINKYPDEDLDVKVNKLIMSAKEVTQKRTPRKLSEHTQCHI